MEEKIPCIKINFKEWNFIKPYLIEWKYDIKLITENFFDFPYLIINNGGEIGKCNNYSVYYNVEKYNNREFVSDVDEFLKRTAELKGFTYNKTNNIEVNGIEIKPGMVFRVNKNNVYELYVVFPVLYGELAVIRYSGGYWDTLSNFIATYQDDIVSIHDLSNCNEKLIKLYGKVLWEKQEEVVISIEELAKQHNCKPEQIKIVF